MTEKELKKEIRKLAKRANTRIAFLENSGYSSSSNAYRYLERLNYDDTDYLQKSRSGNLKFRTALSGLNYQDLQQEYFAINRFLSAKTSTKTGILSKYQKAYESFKESQNMDISFEEYTKIYDDYYLMKYQQMYGSKELNTLVKKYGNNASEVAREIIDHYNELKKNNIEFTIKERDEYMEKFKHYGV